MKRTEYEALVAVVRAEAHKALDTFLDAQLARLTTLAFPPVLRRFICPPADDAPKRIDDVTAERATRALRQRGFGGGE